MKHDKPVYFRTDSKGYKLLQRCSRRLKMSLAEYIRQAIDEKIAREG